MTNCLKSANPVTGSSYLSFSRLGRSVGQIAMLVADLIDQNIGLICIKEGIKTGKNLDITSKVQITMFSLFAEIERDLISQRTTEALAARKAQGVKLGRPEGPGKSKLDQYREEIQAFLNNGSTQVWIANRYQTTPSNLSNWMKRNEIERQINQCDKAGCSEFCNGKDIRTFRMVGEKTNVYDGAVVRQITEALNIGEKND